ncbi:MAG TPA: TonB-dependent receptor [Idiomarina baltica]|uniref:TonB-dependent receptor n=1 Tax=Idiomarina baltica TaxID=190892 RepID=A0A348WL30_9GAMM|nr:TonB-dependent receptor [Alteromonas macleodii]MAD10367.1 TonB-dependent receptor [Alteromonas sp.]HAI70795.1 TonB-dependent receptor [Alteromonas australica]HAR55242.1 TonB-dependent receptor [Idiomarina baltica]|tara:strand:- start:4054 stop:6519 length:2466 start_codon:yes stop_codon:yes gene_type:complete
MTTQTKPFFYKNKLTVAISTAIMGLSINAYAADEEAKPDDNAFEQIVVTGSVGGRTQIESAIAVTSIDDEVIQNFKPNSEVELFRLIPGIQANGGNGPGGNANIAVRGLPVATGGSPFVQIQEDGLPTVLFGDMQFGNNDYWTRFDASTARVESVRGGTATTFASQAPGAIINYISHTGEVEGGYVGLSTGIGYDEKRVDFRYGGSASDSVLYHVGGYMKTGRGPLDDGFNTSESMQVKANITKYLEDDESYVRFYLKVADTQEPFYTGSLAYANISGNKISNVRPYPGMDGRSASNFSTLNQSFLIVNNEGGVERVNMSGITTEALALGNEVHYVLEHDIVVDNKMRWTDMSGGFTEPFHGPGVTANVIGSTVNGAVVDQIRYANGPMAGELYEQPYIDTNTNVFTNISDVGSFVNDLTISKEFNLDGSILNARVGYFYMNQKIAMDWHTNRNFREAGSSNPAQLDLFDAAGNQLTANGLAGFNDNWGDCCARDYDLEYTNTAPYVALELELDEFILDGSVRRDTVDASGYTVQSSGNAFDTIIDGVAIPTLLPDGKEEYPDYSESYTSYTFGGLYKFNEDTSFFARASKGNRFNSDRQTVSGKINPDGSLTQAGRVAAVDEVNQYEVGVKNRGEMGEADYTVEFTLLKGDFTQSNYEPTSTPACPNGGCILDNEYRTTGFEFYGTMRWSALSVIANATYTDAEQKPNGGTWGPANDIPELTYAITSQYEFSQEISVGLNMSGQYGNRNGAGVETENKPIFGGNIAYRPTNNLEFAIIGQNLTDEFALRGLSGVVDASNNVISAQPVLGRNLSASVKLLF